MSNVRPHRPYHLLLLPVLILGLLLTACGEDVATNARVGALAPCSIDDSPFRGQALSTWAGTYHAAVDRAIEAHLHSLDVTATQKLRCEAPDYSVVTRPTAELTAIAQTLDPWKSRAARERLSEAELSPVLLEYLRTYECALLEKRDALLPAGTGSLAGGPDSFYGNEETSTTLLAIDRELAISRTALEHTLLLLSGKNLLRPLAVELECLKRVSLDLRNATGLFAQAAACMPRIRDARGSLRDLSVEP